MNEVKQFIHTRPFLVRHMKKIGVIIAAVLLIIAGALYNGVSNASADTTYAATIAKENPEVLETRTLMQAGGALNIIHIPVAGDTSEIGAQLNASDAAIKTRAAKAFTDATKGRYTPKEVTVANTEAITLSNGCFASDDTGTMERLDNLAVAQKKSGVINVIVTDAEQCFNELTMTQRAGYASNSGMAVVSGAGYKIFERTLAHEVGHKAGLGHAGTEETNHCENGCRSCNLDEMDEYSIMSYQNNVATAHVFSDAELVALGLLPTNEVVHARGDGTYTISTKAGAASVIHLHVNNMDEFVSIQKEENGTINIIARYQSSTGVMVRVNKIMHTAGEDVALHTSKVQVKSLTADAAEIVISSN